MLQRSCSSIPRPSNRQSRQYVGLIKPITAAIGMLKSSCSCLGAPSLSAVDVATLDKDKQHGSSVPAAPIVSIEVRCYEDDDQVSERSISRAGSTETSKHTWAAVYHRRSLTSLWASKLAKLPGFAGCFSYPCVKDDIPRNSTSCSHQDASAVQLVVEGPVLPAAAVQLQEEKLMPAEGQKDSQVRC